MSLRDFQQRFCQVMRTGDMSNWAGDASQQNRFFLYHNNCTTSLIDHLANVFSKTRRLMGVSAFTQEAAAYSRAHPPTMPYLTLYGEGFPDLLHEKVENPLVRSALRFEQSLQQLLRMPLPETFLDLTQLGSYPEEVLGQLRFRFHESVTIYKAAFPLHRLWEEESVPILLPASSFYLMHATSTGAYFKQIPAADACFLMALHEGRSLSEACGMAEEIDSDFDLARVLIDYVPHMMACEGNGAPCQT